MVRKGATRMEREELMKKLDEVLDKHGVVVQDRDALKEDLYHEVIQEAWSDGRQTGRDTYWKWND